MALWRLYYHFVWATKERQPLISPAIQPIVYGYIIGKAHALGAIVHAIGGMEEHIHIIGSVPPKLSIADFVRFTKGSSSHHINQRFREIEADFGWQRGYGVFSLGGKQLSSAIAYVQNQQQHHTQNTINPQLEDYSQFDDGPAIWNYGKAIAAINVNNAIPDPLKPPRES